MSAQVRAWVVAEGGEWRMAWFAVTRGNARVEAANAYGVAEPFAKGFSVRRAPALDPYLDYWREHEDVPAEAWWAAGYGATCGDSWCECPVDANGGCGDPECYHEGAAVLIGDRAYHASCAPGVGE